MFKKLSFILLLLPLISCGVKKELATAQQENIEIQKRLTELENEQTELKKRNQELYNQNQEYRRKIGDLLREQERNRMNTVVDTEIEIFEDKAPKVGSIYQVVEKMPSFPGGTAKLFEYLGKNIKYPQIAKEANVRGKVYVQFVVEKDGRIAETKIIRGIGHGCDKEALRVVNSMPNWIPGVQRGKKVRVRFVLPINFVLK